MRLLALTGPDAAAAQRCTAVKASQDIKAAAGSPGAFADFAPRSNDACSKAPTMWFHAANLGECVVVLPALLRGLLECNVHNQDVQALFTTPSWDVYNLLVNNLPAKVAVKLASMESPSEAGLFFQLHKPHVAVLLNLPQHAWLIATAAQVGAQVLLLSTACTGGEDALRWHAYLMCRRLLWCRSLHDGAISVPSLPEPTQLLLLCTVCGSASAPGMAAVVSTLGATAAATQSGAGASGREGRKAHRQTGGQSSTIGSSVFACCTVSFQAPRSSEASAKALAAMIATAAAVGTDAPSPAGAAASVGVPASGVDSSAAPGGVSEADGTAIEPAGEWEQAQARRSSASGGGNGQAFSGMPGASWPTLWDQDAGVLGSDGSVVEGWGSLLSFSPKAPLLSSPTRFRQQSAAAAADGQPGPEGQAEPDGPHCDASCQTGLDPPGGASRALEGLWSMVRGAWHGLQSLRGSGGQPSGYALRSDGGNRDLQGPCSYGASCDAWAAAGAVHGSHGYAGMQDGIMSTSYLGVDAYQQHLLLQQQQQQQQQLQLQQQQAIERLLQRVILDSWELDESPPGSPAQGVFTKESAAAAAAAAVVSAASGDGAMLLTGFSSQLGSGGFHTAPHGSPGRGMHGVLPQTYSNAHGPHHGSPQQAVTGGYRLRGLEVPDPSSPGANLAQLSPVGGLPSPAASASIHGSIPASPAQASYLQPSDGSAVLLNKDIRSPITQAMMEWSEPVTVPGMRPHRQSFANWLADGSPPQGQRGAGPGRARFATVGSAASLAAGMGSGGDSPPSRSRSAAGPGVGLEASSASSSVSGGTGGGARPGSQGRLETCDEAGESAVLGAAAAAAALPVEPDAAPNAPSLSSVAAGAGADAGEEATGEDMLLSPRKAAAAATPPGTAAAAAAAAAAGAGAGAGKPPIPLRPGRLTRTVRRSLQETIHHQHRPWMPLNASGDLISEAASPDRSDAEPAEEGRAGAVPLSSPPASQAPSQRQGGAHQPQQQPLFYLPPLRPLRPLPVPGQSPTAPPARSISMPPQTLLQLLQQDEAAEAGDGSSSPSTPRLLSRHGSYQAGPILAPMARVRHGGGQGDQGSGGEDVPDTPTSCMSGSSPFAASVHDRPCPFSLSRTGGIVAGAYASQDSRRRSSGSHPRPALRAENTLGAFSNGSVSGGEGSGAAADEDIPDTPTSCMGNSSPFAGSAFDRPCPFSLSRTGSIVSNPATSARSEAGGGSGAAPAVDATAGETSRRRSSHSRFSMEGDARQRGPSGSGSGPLGAPALEGGLESTQQQAGAPGPVTTRQRSLSSTQGVTAGEGLSGAAAAAHMERAGSGATAHEVGVGPADGEDGEEPPTPMSCTGNMSPFADSLHDRPCPFSLSRTGSIVGEKAATGRQPAAPKPGATSAAPALFSEKEKGLLQWAQAQAMAASDDHDFDVGDAALALDAGAGAGAGDRRGANRFAEPPSPRAAGYVPYVPPVRLYAPSSSLGHAATPGISLGAMPGAIPSAPSSALGHAAALGLSHGPLPGAIPSQPTAHTQPTQPPTGSLGKATTTGHPGYPPPVPLVTGGTQQHPTLQPHRALSAPSAAFAHLLSFGDDDDIAAPVHTIVRPVLSSKRSASPRATSAAVQQPPPSPGRQPEPASSSSHHHPLSFPSTASSMSVTAMAGSIGQGGAEHAAAGHAMAPVHPSVQTSVVTRPHAPAPHAAATVTAAAGVASVPAAHAGMQGTPRKTPNLRGSAGVSATARSGGGSGGGAPPQARPMSRPAAASGALLRTVSEPSASFHSFLSAVNTNPDAGGSITDKPRMWPDSPPRAPPGPPAVPVIAPTTSISSAASSAPALGSPPRAPTSQLPSASPATSRAPPTKPRKPQPGSPRRSPMLPTWSTPADPQAPPSPRKVRSLSGRPSNSLPWTLSEPSDQQGAAGAAASSSSHAQWAIAASSAPDSPTSLSRRNSITTPSYRPSIGAVGDTSGCVSEADGFPASPTHSVRGASTSASQSQGQLVQSLQAAAASAAAAAISAATGRPSAGPPAANAAEATGRSRLGSTTHSRNSAAAAVAAATAAAAALAMKPSSSRRRMTHADLTAMVAAATAAALNALEQDGGSPYAADGEDSDDTSSDDLPSAFASPGAAQMLAGTVMPHVGRSPALTTRRSLLSRESVTTTAALKPSLSRAAPSQHPESEARTPLHPSAKSIATPSTNPLQTASHTPITTPLATLSSKYASPIRTVARSPYRQLFGSDGGVADRHEASRRGTPARPLGTARSEAAQAAANGTGAEAIDDFVAATRKRLFMEPEDDSGAEGGGGSAALAAALSSGSTGEVTLSAAVAGDSALSVWKPSFLDDDDALPMAPPTSAIAASASRYLASAATFSRHQGPPAMEQPSVVALAHAAATAAAAASPYKLPNRGSMHTPRGAGATSGLATPGAGPSGVNSPYRTAAASRTASRVQSPYRKLFADSDGNSSSDGCSKPRASCTSTPGKAPLGTPSKALRHAPHSAVPSGLSGLKSLAPTTDAMATQSAAPMRVLEAAPELCTGPSINASSLVSVLQNWGPTEPSSKGAPTLAPAPVAAPAPASHVPIGSSSSLPVDSVLLHPGTLDALRSRCSDPAHGLTGLEGLEHLVKPLKMPLTPRSFAAAVAAVAAGTSGAPGSGVGDPSPTQTQLQLQSGVQVQEQGSVQHVGSGLAKATAPVVAAVQLPTAPLVRYNSLQQQAVTRAGWAALQQQQQVQAQQVQTQQQVRVQQQSVQVEDAHAQQLFQSHHPESQPQVQAVPSVEAMGATNNPLFQELEKIKHQLKDVEGLLAGQQRSGAASDARASSQAGLQARSSADSGGSQGEALKEEVVSLRQQLAEMAQTMQQQQELLVQVQAMMAPRLQQAALAATQQHQQRIQLQQRMRRHVWYRAAAAGGGNGECDSGGTGGPVTRLARKRWSGTQERHAHSMNAASIAADAGTSKESTLSIADVSTAAHAGNNQPCSPSNSSSSSSSNSNSSTRGDRAILHMASALAGDGNATAQHADRAVAQDGEQGAHAENGPGSDAADGVVACNGVAGHGSASSEGGDDDGDKLAPMPASVFSMHAGNTPDADNGGDCGGSGVETEYSLALMASPPLSSALSLGSMPSLGAALSLGPVDALPGGEACAFLAEQPLSP